MENMILLLDFNPICLSSCSCLMMTMCNFHLFLFCITFWQIRGVEIGIVVLVLMVWAGAIGLFFNRWGKIRMLLPYQPDYKQDQLKVPGAAACPPGQCNGHQHQVTLFIFIMEWLQTFSTCRRKKYEPKREISSSLERKISSKENRIFCRLLTFFKILPFFHSSFLFLSRTLQKRKTFLIFIRVFVSANTAQTLLYDIF